jgi:2-methylcitrate dehydratase PrpD
MHGALAAALAHRRLTPDAVGDTAIHDPRVRTLMARTSYELDPSGHLRRCHGGEVVIETTGGACLAHCEEHDRGSDAEPLSAAEVERRFRDDAACMMAPARAQRVLDAAMALDGAADIVGLSDALGG